MGFGVFRAGIAGKVFYYFESVKGILGFVVKYEACTRVS